MRGTCKEEQRGTDEDSFEYPVSIPMLSDRIRMRFDVQLQDLANVHLDWSNSALALNSAFEMLSRKGRFVYLNLISENLEFGVYFVVHLCNCRVFFSLLQFRCWNHMRLRRRDVNRRRPVTDWCEAEGGDGRLWRRTASETGGGGLWVEEATEVVFYEVFCFVLFYLECQHHLIG